MHSIISKLNINFKSIIYLLVLGVIPIIAISVLVLWFSQNQALAKIFIGIGILFFFLILVLTILLFQKLLDPLKKVTENLTKISSDDIHSLVEIDPYPFQDEIKDLLISYNGLLQNQNKKIIEEKLLEEKRSQLEFALQGSRIGLWDWDLQTNGCYYSSTWRNILGHTQESIHNLSTEWFTRVHPEDIDLLQKAISDYTEKVTSHFCHEHRLRHFNDNYVWVMVRGEILRNEAGKAIRFIGTTIDVTAQKNKENQLAVLAMYDPQTGLPNKIYFSGIIDQSLGRIRRRNNYHSAILNIDLDRFKIINDKYGYDIGNQFLLEITRRLKYSLRTMDTIARISDNSFGVLLEEINGLQDAIKITKRLFSEVSKPFALENETVELSASIGIVLLTRGYQNSNEVLRDVETALIQAKAGGRGRIELFDGESYEFQLSKIQIENEILQALENNEFQVQYQPVYSATTKKVMVVDSTIYWKNSEKGVIPHQYFHHTAEDSDATIPLNKFLLRKACQDAWEWSIRYDTNLKVAVRIANKFFLKPDFSELVLGILADSNLPNSSLQLVISENTLINNGGVAIQHIYDLFGIGISFCLDNYGVTPSSLEQIKRLPIKTIRFAESILRDLPQNQVDASIVKAIISLGKNLGIETVAMDVETKEKTDFLVNEGVDYLTGDIFTTPMQNHEFISFLQNK